MEEIGEAERASSERRLIPTRWRIFFSSERLSPARQFFKDSRNVHRTLRIEHCLLHNCPQVQWICTPSVRDIQRDPQCIGDICQHRRWQLKREGCRESRLRNGSKQSSASTGEETASIATEKRNLNMPTAGSTSRACRKKWYLHSNPSSVLCLDSSKPEFSVSNAACPRL